ncbi:unnamed protein product [Pleuronectes platessa]|uniref:Uncharacterized protein n=1 Tax=Pleuronectes platessa TaxID=8262 RepID=A0A9N7VT45_PLEPL|nr:unnamed protein product [Pleuronectes platessa]
MHKPGWGEGGPSGAPQWERWEPELAQQQHPSKLLMGTEFKGDLDTDIRIVFVHTTFAQVPAETGTSWSLKVSRERGAHTKKSAPYVLLSDTEEQRKTTPRQKSNEGRQTALVAKYSLKRPCPRLHTSTPESRLRLWNPIVMPQRPLYRLYVSVCFPEATGIVCA